MKPKTTIGTSLLIILFSQATYATAVNTGTPESGVELGLGWDSQRAEIIPNRCIRFAPVKEEGQSIRMQLQDLSDSSELMEQLSVSAAMSIKSAVGSASAQGKFASNTKISSSSNSLLIRATVDNGVLFAGPSQPVDPVRSAYPSKQRPDAKPPWWIDSRNISPMITLTQEARDVLGGGNAKELREFEGLCGDSFVSAIYSGAELIAVMSIKSKSKTQAKSAQGCIKAKVSAWGAKGEASACTDSEKDQRSGNTEITVDFTQIGGAGGIIPIDQDGLLKKLSTLPSEAQTGPQFHSMDLVAYSDLPDWPHAIRMDTEDNPEEALLSNFYFTLASIQNTLQDAIDHPDQYINEDKTKLKTLQDEVIQYRRDIYDLLVNIQRIGGLRSEVPFLFGLFTKTDPDVAQQKAELEQELVAQITKLAAFNGGSKNPNLIKLKLPLPCTAVENCQGDCNIDGETIVEYYVGHQSRRICQSDPASSECLTNRQLDALAKEVDSIKMSKDTCKAS